MLSIKEQNVKSGKRIRIPFARIDCQGNELPYVREVLESGWLTTAAKTLEFEHRFAAAVGARHACAVNSCTAALHLALESIGVGPGDKVLVPTLTFTATAEVVRYLGADPVFLDVEYGTGLLTPEIVAEGLDRNPGVKAIIVMHMGGQAAQMASEELKANGKLEASAAKLNGSGGKSSHGKRVTADAGTKGILELCRERGVKVIEDAAHAFPTRANGRMIGSFGDATCFSFYANKTITTGEGGMLVTDDEAIYLRSKTMRLHGINRDIWDRFTSEVPSWEYDVVAPGFKYNMPDLNAAIGLAQLERAEGLRRDRQRCLRYYFEHLAGVDGLDLPLIRGSLEDHSCHLFWVVLKEKEFAKNGNGTRRIKNFGCEPTGVMAARNRLIEFLAQAGVGTSVHYKPLHRMTYYRDRYELEPKCFPNAERHWQGCVSLPVYPGLQERELAYIVEQVRRGVGREWVRAAGKPALHAVNSRTLD